MANGILLYEGPSMLDGAPIVVIATGINKGSTNVKTGAMVQTYILRSDVPPIEAVQQGLDSSICGGCPHRGDGTGAGRSCYVTLFHGPRAVFAAYQRDSYPMGATLPHGKMVRLGTYGDPAAVPIGVWRCLLVGAAGWTGYTHQWRTIDAATWAPLVMASVDSETEMREAHALGYRTFRVTPIGVGPLSGEEVTCPASAEAGRKAICYDCKACMGTAAKAKVSIQIAAHGTGRNHV
jgi:hypothetical protein